MKALYGDIPTSKLKLVRAMSQNELAQWTPTDNGKIRLTAQSNQQKSGGGQWLEELGFVGKELNSRNTLHFTLNCAVEDHVYGSFEKDVLFVVPFEAMVSQEKPSSFSEVDVVFPFKSGEITCPMPDLWVREGVEVPTQFQLHAKIFPKEADLQEVIRSALEADDCPAQNPSMHGWSVGSQTLSKEGAEFVSSLGGQTTLSSHASATEGLAEWALTTFAGAAKAIFSGDLIYEDQMGRTREHKEKLALAIEEMNEIAEHATHPNTREYAKKTSDQMLKAQQRVQKCQTEWSIFFENPLDASKDAQLRIQKMLNKTPEECRSALLQRMALVKENAKEHLRSTRPTLEKVLATCVFQPCQTARVFTSPPPLPNASNQQAPRARF